MSKDQSSEQEETNEPLLSIVTTNPIEQSAFASVLAKPAKQPEVTQPIEKKEPIVEPKQTPPPTKKIVYEYTYIDEKGVDVTVYSYKPPVYTSSTTIAIENIFGKEHLYENVLNISEIKSACKIEYEEEQVVVDLNKGIVIKSLEEEHWMILDYESTKKLFDEAVLKAYRNAAAIKTTSLKQADNIQQNNSEYYTEGNIPVHRAPLIQEF